MNFTPQQQQAISQRGRIIVSAAAGSGKTAVMIERLVSLVLSGADVREVLALTFTKKAAAQMRDRLRMALSKQMAQSGDRERRMLARQIENLPLAEIGTIHAFCGRLVRSNFYLADTDAAFRIISPDDAEGKTLKNRAIESVFEEAYAEGDSDFYDLLSFYFRKKKDARLKQIVLDLHAAVRGTEHYRELLGDPVTDFEAVTEELAAGYRRQAAFLTERVSALKPYFSLHNPRALTVAGDVLVACNVLLSTDLFGMVRAAAVPPAIAVMPRMTKATGEEYKNLRFLAGAAKSVKAIYTELRGYADRETELGRFTDAQQRAKALSKLVLRFDDAYSQLKKEANVLDYNDLEHLALSVLKNPDALAALRGRYRYLFVDEYQDVNPLQERILSALGGEEVFLVGDSKQAIYGFRGSNSAFFGEKRKEFGREGGDLTLTANFRSSSAVLGAVNRVFSRILPAYEPMEGGELFKDGERVYEGGVEFHTVVKEKKEREMPRVYSVLGHGGAEEKDPYAMAVADLIEDELARTVFDADEKRERKTEFRDIAVLVRKNSGTADKIVRELNARNIPVSSSSRVDILSFFEARLLLDWLSLLDNGAQDIPLAGAMLSAVGGFTEEDLARIRLAYPAAYAFRTSCSLYAAKENDPLAERLRGFYALLRHLTAKAQAVTAAEMMGELLSMGLEMQIASSKFGSLRLARINRLVREGEDKSVHAFLTQVGTAGRIDYAGGGGENAVQLMTMHASKGLEFPVVILTDLDVPFHGADRDDVMWTEKYRAAPAAFDRENKIVYDTVLRRASAKQQEAEELSGEKNLLYVAMTRAKYRLHMLFEGKEQAIDPSCAGRLSDFIPLSELGDYFVPLPEPQGEAIPRAALATEADEEEIGKILSVYRVPYPRGESVTLPLKSSATELMRMEREEQEDKPARGTAHGHSAEEGIAYHAFLEHVHFGRDAEEELGRMREEGLLTEEQISLLDVGNLRKILSLPCLRDMGTKRIRREQTFLLLLPANEMMHVSADDEVLFQGAIDLLAEDEDGFTVIDYKYSSHDDETIRKTYAPQIRLYKKAVARAMRTDEKSIRARIVNIALLREIEM